MTESTQTNPFSGGFLHNGAEVFKAVFGAYPKTLRYTSWDDTYTAEMVGGVTERMKSVAVSRFVKLLRLEQKEDDFKVQDNELEKFKGMATGYESSLLHWRKAYDEVDARETEAWKQVNQLKQKVRGLEKRLSRQVQHNELLVKQIRHAKTKRDSKIKYLESSRDAQNRKRISEANAKLNARYARLRSALNQFGLGIDEPFKALEKTVQDLDQEFRNDWFRTAVLPQEGIPSR